MSRQEPGGGGMLVNDEDTQEGDDTHFQEDQEVKEQKLSVYTAKIFISTDS